MSILGDLTGIGPILDVVTKVINRIIPDPEKAAEAKLEMEKALIGAQNAIYDAMSKVMVADSQSESWLTRNIRPIAVCWGLCTISWIILSPIFGLQKETLFTVTQIPSDLWNLVTVGIGAYILGRSAEKSVKNFKQ